MADHIRRFTAITHPKIYLNYLLRGTPAIWALIMENIQKYGEQTIEFLQYFMEKNSTLIAAVTAASVTASLISYSAKKVAVPVLNEEVHENIREDLEKMESMLQKLLKVQSEILLATNPGPRLQHANSIHSGNETNGYESSNYSSSENQNEEDLYATTSNTNHTPPLSPHGQNFIHLQQNDAQNNTLNRDDGHHPNNTIEKDAQNNDLNIDYHHHPNNENDAQNNDLNRDNGHHPNNTTENLHINDDVISISSVASSVSSVASSGSVDIATDVATTPPSNVVPRRRRSKRNREPPRKHLMTTFTPQQQKAWDKEQRRLQKLARRQKKQKLLLRNNTATDSDVQYTTPHGVVV